MYGLSGSNLAIGVSLVLRDRFTGGANAAAASMRNLSKETLQAQRQQMSMQRDINATGAMIGGLATMTMASWYKVGAEFDYTMKYIGTIAEKKGNTTFDTLSDKAKQLGSSTMFTAQQVASGMQYMAMAGQSTESIYNNITAAVNLAGATMSQIEGKGGAADIMTNIMKGFDIADTEKNATRVADILTSATTGANTNLWDLHEAMKYSVSTASTLGGGIEELAASVMMLGNAGIQGSMSGVAIENMYRYIARAVQETKSNKQGKALASLGLEPGQLKESTGELKSMSSILHLISGALEGMAEVDQTKGLGTVFGYNAIADMMNVRGARAGTKLLQNVGDFDKFVDRLNSSGGLAAKNMGDMMGTAKGTIDEMTSAWETFKISFMEALAPAVTPVLTMLTYVIDTIRRMTETNIGKFLTMMAGLGIVATTAVMGYRAVVLSLRLLHMDMGANILRSSGMAVSGWNAATAAAARYAGVAGGATMGAGVGGARSKVMGALGFGTLLSGKSGRYQNKKTGKFVSTAVGDRYTRMTRGKGVGGRSMMGKFGSMAGKGSLAGMIGGTALSMGGDMVGGATGKGMSIAGDAIGYAGTGAMIGSMFGPVGTGVGALIGGLGSLAYSIYNELDTVKKDLDDAVDAAEDIKDGKKSFDANAWKAKATRLLSMYEGDSIYGAGVNPNNLLATTQGQANSYLQGGNQAPPQSNITIIIDGKKAMEQTVTKSYYKTLISLGAL